MLAVFRTGPIAQHYDHDRNIIHDVHIEPAHEVKKRSISQPVRILLSYDESVFRRASTIAIRLNKYGFYRRRLVVTFTMGVSNPLRILYNAHRDL
ncbi:hypothetical protein ALC57_18063 [Trachymyrmex cornetzi]|uniref:Uncharacterized protein n=1 Tax=Trachymyrmex cornetzi TaxID=471704 RepID=A0A151ISH0_9HYME|nr:hypothetical protein ALC57_18063 [Trachymyrmex cornetzi]